VYDARFLMPLTRPLAVVFLIASLAAAQFNPAAGQWGKTGPDDVRVMSWNVQDAICSTNSKVAGQNNWSAVARIIAALKPDVLVLQECGDNDGNNTGTGVDSVTELTTTIGYLLHGGADSFNGGAAVTAYVQLYAPGYDLPYVFVPSVDDGFNRNVILSRWPFADLNGDTKSTLSNIPTITAELYAAGGNGGIRGFQTAEIDLPGAAYAGDLVVGNCHLKAGSGSSDHNQRVTAAKNIAYFVDYFWNGAGGTTPDPHGKIADSPPATSVLGPNTAFVAGGDWNEDEAGNGATIGPADWITRAAAFNPGGSDGPDRNRTDMTYDAAVDPFTGSNQSFSSGSSRFDYVSWQDSLVTARAQFKFNSASVPAPAMPAALVGWGPNLSIITTTASDHRPVIVDLALPAPLGCNSAGSDRGFATLSGAAKFPRFSVCGNAATGGTVTSLLSSAPASQTAWLGISGSSGWMLLGAATIVPTAPSILGPFSTDAGGALSLSFPGGGGPLVAFGQWAIADPAVPLGISFSNAEAVTLLP
jgi:endonuclease/exonuclease/phosphatase family metal-dependent hydrolase